MRVSGVKLLNLGNTEDILGREIELGEMRGGVEFHSKFVVYFIHMRQKWKLYEVLMRTGNRNLC